MYVVLTEMMTLAEGGRFLLNYDGHGHIYVWNSCGASMQCKSVDFLLSTSCVIGYVQ